MSRKIFLRSSLLILLLLQFCSAAAEPLPSWNNGPIKESIIRFVAEVTNKSSPNYVAPEDRIATFDNDGTLWLEQPIYTQVIFSLDQVKKLYPQHPEWKTQAPFSIILSGDKQAIAKLSILDLARILTITESNLTVEAFQKNVQAWLAQTKNPHYHRIYTQLVYQPMLEVMQYLREHNFNIYIVTGGGQDFVRAFSEKIYGVARDKVIGTVTETKYTYQNGKPILIKLPKILFIDDKTGKPESINLFIGKKPIIAFGNSDGDREMLEWTQSGEGKRLMLLVHHDDAKREYAYGPNSKIGTFSNALMQEAQKNNWKIISMQHDWKIIFPFEKEKSEQPLERTFEPEAVQP